MRATLMGLILTAGAFVNYGRAADPPLMPEPEPPAGVGLRITGTLKVPQWRLVELSVDGIAPDAAIIWDVSPEERASVREMGAEIVFTGPPGKYAVKVRTIQGKKVLTGRAVVEIDGDAPKPPAPPPTPPPVPPPGPPPTPTDPFVVELAALAAAEKGTAAPAQIKQLAALYGQIVPWVGKAEIVTVGDLCTKLNNAAADLSIAGALTTIQQRVKDELLRKTLDDPEGKFADFGAALTPAMRAKASSIFGRAATALEVAK